MPETFDSVDVYAVHVAFGITAVVARIRLSEVGQNIVNEVWHADHKPRLRFQTNTGVPRALTQKEVALTSTQQSRASLHADARKWLATFCAGTLGERLEQPIIDLLLLDKYDPRTPERPGLWARDCLAALGIRAEQSEIMHVEGNPSLHFDTAQYESRSLFEGHPTWYLWGNTEAVLNSLGSGGTVTSEDFVEAHTHDIAGLLVEISMHELLNSMERSYAELRDGATQEHRQFGVRRIKTLRQNLLTLSFDTSNTVRDIQTYNRYGRQFPPQIQIVEANSPWNTISSDPEIRYPTRFNDRVRRIQSKTCERLLKTDQEYRSTLSTVADLGAAASSLRLASVSLVVAFVSLVVAGTAVFLTKIETDTYLHAALDWIYELWTQINL